MNESWIFHRDGIDFPASEYAYLANGYVGLRIPPWGNGCATTDSRCVISGLHNIKDAVIGMGAESSRSKTPVRLPVIDRLDVLSEHNSSVFEATKTATQTSQSLNIQDGTLTTRTETGGLEIEQLTLCNQHHHHIVQQRLRLKAKSNVTVWIDARIDPAPVSGFLGSAQCTTGPQSGNTFVAQTERQKIRLKIQAKLFIQGHASETCGELLQQITLQSGDECEIWKCISITDDRLSERSPRTLYEVESIRHAQNALHEHRLAWAERWKSRIEAGNPHWARLINMAQYNLKSSHNRNNPWGLPAMGLSSYSWEAYVFPWDSALWMFPYFLLTEPQAAHQMLEFEMNGMLGQQTRLEYYSAGSTVKMYEAGCVAWAAWQYYCLTRDKKWLAERGFKILQAAGEGYYKRATFNESLGQYEIKGVWPTDEYAPEDCDNNTFTNAIAQRTLTILNSACQILKQPFPNSYNHLLKHGFWLPFDEDNQRHIEYSKWNNGQCTQAYDGSPIKQADVNLINFPLRVPMPEHVERNNLTYYMQRIGEDGPEMTWGVFATIAAKLRDEATMMHCLRKLSEFFQGSLPIMRETKNNTNTVFMTGCADLMQALLFGCCGIQFDEHEFKLSPFIPDELGEIRVHGLEIHSIRHDVILKKEQMTPNT